MSDQTAISPDIWTQRFIPDRLTPLPFTPEWQQLRSAEQLRYNQLHGLFFHEQIIFFEQAIIVPLMRAVQQHIRDDGLRHSLDTFIAEECVHSSGFHGLLRTLRPEWYATDWHHFVRLGAAGDAALTAMVRRPQQFPCLLWLVQLLEERTMFASRLYLAEAEAFPPGMLALHRQHLIDEADHVQWDTALIAELWDRTPAWLRRVNVRLLDWILGEFIAVPRRAAMRVIDALAVDLPDLCVPPIQLKAALRTLGRQPGFRGAVFGRDAVPRTWKQAAATPELSGLVQRWFAHDHAP